MGTKENIEYIKNELDSEEKLLESVIKAEKFFKRYKKPIVAGVGLVVAAAILYFGYEWKEERDIQKANIAYNRLLQNPRDKSALEELKSANKRLYTLYLYQKGLANKDLQAFEEVAASGDPILSDLANYHIAVLQKDQKRLEHYASDETLLKEMALLDEAYLLMKSGELQKAKSKLDAVPQNSEALLYAKMLKHYGLKESK